ncbi:MAG: hypothetical protein A2464_07465 [Deltaproteobacteria bacterium RIFOXYC2_FULL_48_10]|nr:MAG: hypothetical protein A2464_07465 [Deltaproteobacteria bacterium RIFOXYC2_FULL_48_10]
MHNRKHLAEQIDYSPQKIDLSSISNTELGNRFLENVTYQDLVLAGLDQELFSTYGSIFSKEHKKQYHCIDMNCAKIYPLDGPHKEGYCICGKPLTEYFNKCEMLNYYAKDNALRYNVLLDDTNHLAAFTCGKIIKNAEYGCLLGKHFALYQSRFPDINNISKKMQEYFVDQIPRENVDEIFYADAGLVVPKYRFNFEYLVTTTKCLLAESFANTNGRLVCINYCGSTMQKINLALGFDIVQEYGDLAFMANIDIGPQLYLYQHFQRSEIVKIINKLLTSNK